MAKKISTLYKDEIIHLQEYGLHLPTRTVYLPGATLSNPDNDAITSSSAASFIKSVHLLERYSKAKINIILSSPGGDWYYGMAIYDVLKNSRCRINITVYGQACSMASLILQAGDSRIMAPNAIIMIHDGSDGYYGVPKSFVSWAEEGERLRHEAYKIYYDKMKEKKKRITLKDIEEMCSHDTIFHSKEAVAIGLADEAL